MSADPRTDPPTPDGLTLDQRELLTDATRAAASIGLHFPALCHAFGIPDTIEPLVTDLFAALPSAPDQRLREALDYALEWIDAEVAYPRPDPHPAMARLAADLRAALSEATTSPETTLDVAWREAEAALPEGWRLTLGRLDDDYASWSATAVSPAFFEGENDNDADCQTGEAMTPAAALHALAARLRGPA